MEQGTPASVWMTRAIALAEHGRGTTSPNPMVGAVLVAAGPRGDKQGGDKQGGDNQGGDKHVVGEGYHAAAGRPHAEAEALTHARGRARGATLYVTLEPCAHHGRTPPCADALVAAGVAHVVAALPDPDPRVAGAGVARLQAAGITVEVGDGADQAAEQNAAFLTHRRRGRPRITLKAAASLDGKVAAADRTSQWITGPAARADAHRLRAQADVVTVGAGTALADDPQLTARPAGPPPDRQPLRLLVDAAGRVPATGRLFTTGGPTLVATTARSPAAARSAWAAAGAEVLVLPDDPHGVDLAALAAALGQRQLLEWLVEGGPALHASFWRAGLADRLVWYFAPMVLGGDTAPGLISGAGAPTLAAARTVRLASVRPLGTDLRVIAYPEPAAHQAPVTTSVTTSVPAAAAPPTTPTAEG